MSAHTLDSLHMLRQLWNDAQEEMHRKPRHSLQNARIAAERICKNLCIEYALEHKDDAKWQVDFEEAGLGQMTGMLYKAKVIPRIISTNLFTIQHFGNMGAHDIGSESIHLQTQYIESCFSALTSVILWYFESYAREDQSELITQLKQKQRHNDFYDIFAHTQETAHELEQILLTSINQVKSMQMMGLRYIAQTPKDHTHPLTKMLSYSPRKNMFHLDEGDEAEGFDIEQIGNLTGPGPLEEKSPEFWREINMALSLTTSFEITKSLIADSEWVYYTSSAKFIYIMPWEAHRKSHHCYSDNLLTLEFFTGGHPENNPRREYFWTQPYSDLYGLGLMVTIAAPIDDGDTFLGTVALDLSFDLFSRHLRLHELPESTFILVNEHHQVLGHPTKIDSKDKTISYLWDVETGIQAHHETALVNLEPANTLPIGGRKLFYVPIDHTNWRLYCVDNQT